jgi:hypothetical protein
MHVRCGNYYWNNRSREFFEFEALASHYKSKAHAERVMATIGRKRIPEGHTKEDLRIELGSQAGYYGSFGIR